jgi:hypothetical protein
MNNYSIPIYIWRVIPADIRVTIPHKFTMLKEEVLIEFNTMKELASIFQWIGENFPKSDDTINLQELVDESSNPDQDSP